MPIRVQRKRTKGWRAPAGTVNVARPSRYGNDFRVGDPDPDTGLPMTRADAVRHFKEKQLPRLRAEGLLAKLAGSNLMCFCPLGEPCHVDVLLVEANTPSQDA